jgi:hypothetical protein
VASEAKQMPALFLGPAINEPVAVGRVDWCEHNCCHHAERSSVESQHGQQGPEGLSHRPRGESIVDGRECPHDGPKLSFLVPLQSRHAEETTAVRCLTNRPPRAKGGAHCGSLLGSMAPNPETGFCANAHPKRRRFRAASLPKLHRPKSAPQLDEIYPDTDQNLGRASAESARNLLRLLKTACANTLTLRFFLPRMPTPQPAKSKDEWCQCGRRVRGW